MEEFEFNSSLTQSEIDEHEMVVILHPTSYMENLFEMVPPVEQDTTHDVPVTQSTPDTQSIYAMVCLQEGIFIHLVGDYFQ